MMAAAAGTGPPQFVLFGDSLTQRGFETDKQGWAASLANEFIRRVDIVNRGFSGYNTDWCRQALPHVLKSVSAPLALISILLGANDAVLPGCRQYVPVQRYQENLHWMIDSIHKQFPDTKIILITPPAVYPPDWESHCHEKGRDLDRSVEHTRLYVDACRDVYYKYTNNKNIALVDIYGAMENYAGLKVNPSDTAQLQNIRSLLCDGLHFSAKGNQLLFELVKNTIVTKFPTLAIDNIPHYFPWHDQIDTNDLNTSVVPYGL